MSDNDHRVLLLSPTKLNGKGIGSIFLRDLISSAKDIVIIEHKYVENSKPLHFVVSLLNRSRIFRAFGMWLFLKVRLRKFTAEVEKNFTDSHATVLWLVLADAETISLADQLVAHGYSIKVMIWDAPEYLLRNLTSAWPGKREVLQGFERVMRRCECAAVISESMQEDYSRRFGTKCHIVRHGLAPLQSDMPRNPTPQVLKIGFAGSLYAKQEWNSFVNCLEDVEWSLGSRKIELHFVGKFPLTGAKKPKGMIEYGYCDAGETAKLLSKLDIGYLPYWLDKEFELVARTSFPGKLTTYAAAGLVIFNHAPQYADVTNFLEKYPFGKTCSSLERSSILSRLDEVAQLINSPASDQARALAMNNELSQSQMAKSFSCFISSSLGC